jgi:hypothetical protein
MIGDVESFGSIFDGDPDTIASECRHWRSGGANKTAGGLDLFHDPGFARGRVEQRLPGFPPHGVSIGFSPGTADKRLMVLSDPATPRTSDPVRHPWSAID